ncbi:MAG: hypothetical protein AABX99_04445 [Nanoarchaeota archaeon]
MKIRLDRKFSGKLMPSYFVNATKCLTRNEQSGELKKPEVSNFAEERSEISKRSCELS